MNFPRSATRLSAWLFLPVLIGFGFQAKAAVAPGEIAIGELNCIACHSAEGAVKDRLASRKSPLLGSHGARVSPQWIRAFLANPQAEKPGTLMPDLLHALPAAQKAEAIEALTHFLVSMQKGEGAQAGASTAAINTGRKLYHTVGCVACHAPQEVPPNSPNDQRAKAELGQIQKASLQLGDISRKYTVADLAGFLRDPLATRPSGRMPSLKLTEDEARAIAIYLLRDQMAGGTASKLHGVAYEYYEFHFPELPDFDKIKPKSTGNADTFTASVAQQKNDFALRFRGIITVPKAGDYQFFTKSDDGSRLSIDGREVVENNGIHPVQEKSGKVTLTAGEHEIMAVYFDAGGEMEFSAWWEGPGIRKQEIPGSVLSHEGQAMRPVGEVAFTVDASKAARGKALFAQLNCAACHGMEPATKAKPLAQIAGAKGCLAPKPAANVPKFILTEAQRAAIVAQLANQAPLAAPLTPAEQVVRTMTVLNCFACHNRDQNGGPGLRNEYFISGIEADLGDEGRIPPALNGVGVKLKNAWMKKVLTAGASVRPYMATRMPQFGELNVRQLPDAFEQADTAANSAPDLPLDELLAKPGHKLVGTGGLSCVQCHVFNGHASLGVPALDLTTVYDRLKFDWFRRYLLDPQALRPGTRMPPFWPGGVAANKDILGGDSAKQIAAIWAFLSRGKSADMPAGLVQAKLELVAETNAIVYRHFIEGGGSRAIGVGYPEKLNLVFDANAMRLAMIWQGPFMDASKQRTGRGTGYEAPLGYSVIKFPEGASFATLASPDAPWPDGGKMAWSKDEGDELPYHFHGYTLDEKLRPAFRYSFGEVSVEDYTVPVVNGNDTDFKRTVTLHAAKPAAGLYFRAAAGAKIEDRGNGLFVVDGKLRLKFDGAKPAIRHVGDKDELLVAVTFQNNEAKLVETISW